MELSENDVTGLSEAELDMVAGGKYVPTMGLALSIGTLGIGCASISAGLAIKDAVNKDEGSCEYFLT